MSFADFKASGRAVADLSTIPNCDSQGAMGPGRVYACDLFIEGAGPLYYCLTLGSDSCMGELPSLERKLYDWAVDEGYIP